MTDTLNSARGWKAAGATLALLAAAALPLTASAQQAAVAPAPAAEITPDAMTVVRDAETGKLRAPTAAEMVALSQATAGRRVRAAAGVPLTKYHSSGAKGMRLTEEMLSTSVAVRNDDGSLDKQCLEQGHSDAAVHSVASHKPQPAKE